MAKASIVPTYAPEWEETQINRFNAIIARDLDKLLRTASTEYNFKEIEQRVRIVIQQVALLAENYDFWSVISEGKRTQINSVIDDMTVQFNEMEAFDAKQSAPWENRNSLIANFNSRYNGFYDAFIDPLSAYLGTKAYSHELTSEFGKEAKKELDEIKSAKREISKIQKDVQDAATVAGNVGSAASAASFGDQAKEHQDKTRKWFWGLITFGIIASIVALFVTIDVLREFRDKSYQSSSEAYAVKLAILAFLFIGVRFIIRNYSAHQHLYIVNKQRANTLSSMESFRNSAITDDSKDAILLAAVSAAYTPQETGFLTTKEGAGSDDSDIIGIVEAAMKRR